jgi:protocatechuate 3,4-dioxygenase beta subunit
MPVSPAHRRLFFSVPVARLRTRALTAGATAAVLLVSLIAPASAVAAPVAGPATSAITVAGTVVSGLANEGVGEVLVALYPDSDAEPAADVVPAGYATTDADGQYRVVDVDAGAYRVHIVPADASLQPEWWDNSTTWADSTLLDLTQNRDDIDVVLDSTSTTVVVPETEAPTPADVPTAAPTAEPEIVAPEATAPVTTDTVVPVAPETAVPVTPETAVPVAPTTSAPIAPETSAPVAPAPEPTDPEAVENTPGANAPNTDDPAAEEDETLPEPHSGLATRPQLFEQTPSILAATGSISGTVTGPGGVAVGSGGYVYAYLPDFGGSVGYSPVSESGTYSISGLVAGRYTLQFYSSWDSNFVNEWWNDKPSYETANYFELTNGQAVISKDAVLAVGATISGTVTSAANASVRLENVSVTAYNSAGDYVGNVLTDSAGLYSIPQLPAGTYTLQFNGSSAGNYLTEWWDNQPSQAAATYFTVATAQNVTGKSASLSAGASISGTIKGAAATPVALVDAQVRVLDEFGYQVAWDWTDSTGAYSVGGLDAGTYTLQFDAPNGLNYVSEWWNDKASAATATAITLATSQTLTGRNVVLAVGATVSGTVTAGTPAAALPEIHVGVYNAAGLEVAGAQTDQSGRYSVLGLAAGTYTLKFDPSSQFGNYASEWWNNQTSFDTATTFALTAGQTMTGKNALLAAGATISGTVTGGTPAVALAEAGVSLYRVGAEDEWITSLNTGANGTYSIDSLPAGTYVLSFSASGATNLLAEWWNDSATRENATTITVTAGQVVSATNAELSAGASVSGKITGGSPAAPIARAQVSLQSSNGSGLVITADEDGNYAFDNVTPGSYTLEFSGPETGGSYITEWWENAASQSNATTITVGVGETVTGKDAFLESGGSISGSVTANGPSTLRLANVYVNVETADGSRLYQTNTDVLGNFTVGGLPAGSYKLYFDGSGAGNYISEWWNDQSVRANAELITVGTGQAVTGKNAVLVPGASITGTVSTVGSEVADLERVYVYAYDASGLYVGYSPVASTGRYVLDGLRAGSVTLQFNATGAGNFVDEWWNNKASRETADAIVLAAGESLTGRDVVLDAGASISGNIKSVGASSTNLAGIDVYAYPVGSFLGSSTTTDNNGNYTLSSLRAGTYVVQFSGGDYFTEWWNDAATRETATSITLTAGQVRSGISPTLAKAATISGTVTGAGSPAPAVAGAWVYVYDANGLNVGSTLTDSAGNYTVGPLAAGSYTLSVEGSNTGYISEWWNNKTNMETADKLTVTAGQALTGRNIQLARGASISGTISGVGLPNAASYGSVTAYDSAGGYVASASTSSTGEYIIRGLAAGTYKLYFSTSGYLSEWWNDKATRELADTITVTAGQALTGKNAVLARGGSIAGTVTGAVTPSVKLENIYVTAYNADQQWIASAITDATGAYVIGGLPAGNYTLNFNGNSSYVGQWWSGKATHEQADFFPVAANETVTGKNVALVRGASISGNVKGTVGTTENLTGAYVEVYGADGSLQTGASTDTAGNYTVAPLAAGTYTMRINEPSGSAYAFEWWNNKTTKTDATAFTLTAGQAMTGANVVLTKGATISGTVASKGTPNVNLSGASVSAWAADGTMAGSASTSSEGTYTITGLAAGNYTLRFVYSYGPVVNGPLAPQWWSGKSTRLSANTFVVAAGAALTGKNAVLAPAATISGTVTDADGKPLPQFSVGVWEADNTSALPDYQVSSVAPDGKYSVPGLAAGSYKVGFTDHATGVSFDPANDREYVSEYWNDKPTLATANSLTVAEGATATSTNATLVKKSATPTFADVGADHPFFTQIGWMSSAGISTGYDSGGVRTFRPADSVTRQAMAAFLYRMAGSPNVMLPPTPSFTDVPTSHPFYLQIEWMKSAGISTGNAQADGSALYLPGDPVSRQAMSAFLYRFAGSPDYTPPATSSFTDVGAGQTFYKQIEWMASTGITTGYDDGGSRSYRPLAAVTRQAMAAFLYRFDQLD